MRLLQWPRQDNDIILRFLAESSGVTQLELSTLPHCKWGCPCGLHSVISRLLAGGALVCALCLCCFMVHRLLHSIFVDLLFRSCFLCHTNPWGDTILSSLLVRFRCPWTDQLITGRAVFGCFFWVFLFVWVGFGFLLFAFSFLHGDSSMDNVSILFSSLLYAHCHHDRCHCSNSPPKFCISSLLRKSAGVMKSKLFPNVNKGFIRF